MNLKYMKAHYNDIKNTEKYSCKDALKNLNHFVSNIYNHLNSLTINDSEQASHLTIEYDLLNKYLVQEITRHVSTITGRLPDQIIALKSNIYRSLSLIKDVISISSLKCRLTACQIKVKNLEHKLEATLYSKWTKNPLITATSDLLSKVPFINYARVKIGWAFIVGVDLIRDYYNLGSGNNRILFLKTSR